MRLKKVFVLIFVFSVSLLYFGFNTTKNLNKCGFRNYPGFSNNIKNFYKKTIYILVPQYPYATTFQNYFLSKDSNCENVNCKWIQSSIEPSPTNKNNVESFFNECTQDFHGIFFDYSSSTPISLKNENNENSWIYNYKKPKNQKWILYGTEPIGSIYNTQLMHNKDIFDWEVTYHLHSDFPFTFFRRDLKFYQDPPFPTKDKINAVFLWQKNCHASENYNRTFLWEKFIQFSQVHSYSACLTNRNSTEKLKEIYDSGIDSIDDKFDEIEKLGRRYKFMLTFENSIDEDYVSEKAWTALRIGTVPIYYGAPNIEKILPPNSFIDVRKFSSIQEVANHVNWLMNNDEEYNKLLQWKINPSKEWENFLNEKGNTLTFVYQTLRTGNWTRLSCDICEAIAKIS